MLSSVRVYYRMYISRRVDEGCSRENERNVFGGRAEGERGRERGGPVQ